MKEAMDSTKPQRYYQEETNRNCRESNPSDINYDDSQNNVFKAQSNLHSHESTEKRLNDEPNIGKNTEEKQEPEGFPKNSNSKNILQSPNDSGPYEEIDEDIPSSSNVHDIDRTDEETLQRPPLGRLPSYISLTSFKDDVNDHELDERICLSKGSTFIKPKTFEIE